MDKNPPEASQPQPRPKNSFRVKAMPPTPEHIAAYRQRKRQQKREEAWERWRPRLILGSFILVSFASLVVGMLIGRFLL